MRFTVQIGLDEVPSGSCLCLSRQHHLDSARSLWTGPANAPLHIKQIQTIQLDLTVQLPAIAVKMWEVYGRVNALLMGSLKLQLIASILTVLQPATAHLVLPSLCERSLTEAQSSKKHISSRAVVIILLLCVILTTLAFLFSVACYFYRRDKCAIQPPVFSSDRETSFNSATNLINHRIFSLPEIKVPIDSPIKHITGCFHKSSCLLGSKTGAIHGVIIQFTYSELQNATEKFSNSSLIGVGGSSYVYRGKLKDGRTVAIKQLKNQKGPDADTVFSKEIELLSRLNHCHVVPLVGYCCESHGKHAERLLVFEYIPNGNLRDCLDGALGKTMDWATRVAIAIGAARGLEYLHEAAAPRILHRDVKSTNILLDEELRAKITDLGMAKHLRADGLFSSSNSPARMEGTFGYFAPEYAIIGRASLKSDVFSFGVVLLELITGRPPIHKRSGKGEESLVIWATPRLQDSSRIIVELADPHLDGKFPEEEMQIMAYLAKECLLLDPDTRPTMGEVVQILSTIAPERSRRTNISVNFSQRSSAYGTHSEECIDRPDWNHISKQHINVEGFQDVEELKRVMSYERSGHSLPLDVDRALCIENNVENEISAEYMERLVLLASKARSWRAVDHETIDLTEPRFESFRMGNHWCKIWIHLHHHRRQNRCSLQLPATEDSWNHVCGCCVVAAYLEAAAPHSLNLCLPLPDFTYHFTFTPILFLYSYTVLTANPCTVYDMYWYGFTAWG
ncbi:Serine/threonine protein kinase [Parasponia andersonii]|uniref:non-specific serine/threonine protein kinase n=1 Tax=Parasponia andersonii TaxID=3476 RepID=A0A2P5B1H5_PARAD|nr:Serine/threonine protein kinase [Parasponia andersonii]